MFFPSKNTCDFFVDNKMVSISNSKKLFYRKEKMLYYNQMIIVSV